METTSVDHYSDNLYRHSSFSVGHIPEIPEIRWNDGKGSYVMCGDALTILEKLPDSFIQTVITSPPYYGMRDYGIPGQIGAERYLDDYIAHLVAIFREVRRTLTDDGTIWINIGDTYTSGNRKTRDSDKKNPARKMDYRPPTPEGLKPKDLIGIPWRLALALLEDGWYLRSDIIWHKPNCQPESVKDRPTRSHEYVFLLSKNERFYYNHSVMKEPDSKGDGLRNLRTVWSINTVPNAYDHSAIFPEGLIEPCVVGGSKEGDIVLDPFFGTGIVGIVSRRLGRCFLGIELNPDFINISLNRLSQQTL